MSIHVSKKPPASVTSEPQEIEDRIRVRAYELYEARGRDDGHDLEDWLRAEEEEEEEVAEKKARTIAA